MDRTGDLSDWIGQSETRVERIAPFPANALAATLGREGTPLGEGGALPPLAHWLHFLPVFPLDQANYDGHARLGEFMPPVPLPRRMWAGGRLRFLAPMRIGAMLRRVSTVIGVEEKTGRSGDLVFVTLRHQIFDRSRAIIDEEQDIVYRPAPVSVSAPGAPAARPRPAPEGGDFSRRINPDPVMLFRYSALTFNGHRIHYDLPFCQQEGYSGLVVHGPLLATLLADLVGRHLPGRRIAGFSYRAMAPVVTGAPFSIHGRPIAGPQAEGPTGDRVRLWVRRDDGALAMDAEAVLVA